MRRGCERKLTQVRVHVGGFPRIIRLEGEKPVIQRPGRQFIPRGKIAGAKAKRWGAA